ncbi:nitronate monooxygenase [Paremcibacter congregatus]|uniref:NAD(P)H-dependent flavin oxidoreductase n=1 Tax=Paremcibacter congregatus TaxID=2043170 RepID=UPI0030EE9964
MPIPDPLKNHLRLPLISAPMFLVSGPDLVIASCKAGVVGSFPTLNARTIDILDQWMSRITTELDQARMENPSAKIGPWAANLIVHSSNRRLKDDMELVLKYKPPIVITALGGPAKIIEAVHSYGGQVYADVNSISYAKKAAATGVDGLVLVCSGAGGHTGQTSNFAFVTAVREFFDGTIILAGGISQGGAIRAAEMAGADFAYMGTSFIAAEESMADAAYKQMLIDSTVDDITCTNAFTGAWANMLQPSIDAAGIDLATFEKTKEINTNDAQGESKAWKNIWSAGHGVGVIAKTEPAQNIVDRLYDEYQAACQIPAF